MTKKKEKAVEPKKIHEKKMILCSMANENEDKKIVFHSNRKKNIRKKTFNNVNS